MFTCPVCEVENRSDAKFCRKCGQSRSALEQYVQVSLATKETPTVSSDQQHLGLPADNAEGAGPNGDDRSAIGAAAKIELANDQDKLPDFGAPECPSCWNALRFSDKFCSWCGEPQPLRTLPSRKVCSRCNMNLPEKANFCYACGSEVVTGSRNRVRFPFELFREEESEDFPKFEA